MGILGRAMRGDRVDRATRSSAGRTYADGDRGVEHWLNHGITGRSRWIELAWLSIAASLLAIVISEVGPRDRKEEPQGASARHFVKTSEGVHSTRVLLASSAFLLGVPVGR